MVKRMIRTTSDFFRKASEDSLAAYAAQTTFFVMLSFFPFIMLLIMIASRMSITRTNVVLYLLDVAPKQLQSYILYIVDDIVYSNNNSFTIITVLVSLWSAGKGIQALTYGLDKIYGVEKTKNFFISRLLSAVYTLAFMLMCLVIMVVHVFGKQIGLQIIEKKPSMANATIFILSLKNAFTFIIIFLFLLLIYYQLPGRKGRVKHELTGAAIAALAWMLMSRIFSFYIQNVASASYMYGSLTSIILIIIWLYIGMQIVLYGAEINYHISEYLDRRAREDVEVQEDVEARE
ncbi:MAG: YihY/virulence factor BrkB family protein [Wujia sp.]